MYFYFYVMSACCYLALLIKFRYRRKFIDGSMRVTISFIRRLYFTGTLSQVDLSRRMTTWSKPETMANIELKF
jgi:hypothetical protein